MVSLRPPSSGLQRAKVAVAVSFGLNGLALSSWLSRLPNVRDVLGLSSVEVGLLLLCVSAGAFSALTVSGLLVTWLGPGRAVLSGAVVVAVGLGGLALALVLGSPGMAGGFLFVFGAGSSPWDVAMNVEAADVERRLARPVMPRFHAGFSLGTVAGAALGAGAAALGVSVAAQLLLTVVLVVLGTARSVRRFLALVPAEQAGPRPRTRDAWRERRTVLIGVFVLAFALTEGVANDWIALALVDGHGASASTGAVAYGVFVAAMTTGRLGGGAAVQRWGRVPTLRAAAVTALVGLLLVVFTEPLAFVLIGSALWGTGAALGFPLGMSAAAADPARAATRVAVVSAVGYTAFLAGPPLIGLLAQSTGILRALLLAVVALVVAFVLAGATR